jgi:hypothetical protein
LIFYLLPDEELFELLLFDEFELLDFESLFEFDERLGVVVVPDERLGVVVVPDERLGVVVVPDERLGVVEVPDERLGVVVVPDERLGVVVVPDERLGVVVVPDERLGVVEAEDGFLVPVLDDGLVVTEELLDGVEFVTPDCLVVVPSELRTDVPDELLVPLLDGRVELLELLDGVETGLA